MKRRKEKARQFRHKAFSLIELSVVLIVLGLLLAAIMKGRDLIRNAEIKKFYNNFIKQWEIVYSAYYDRTGKVLGAPLVVKDSSGKYYEYKDYVGADRYISDSDLVFRVPTRFKITDPTSVSNKNCWIGNLLVATGMEIPEIVRGYPNIYDLSASDVGKTTVIISFGSDAISKNANMTIYRGATGVDSDGNPVNDGDCFTAFNEVEREGYDNEKGNFMVIFNLPYDIAAQIDKFIDGEANGKEGNFICADFYTTPHDIEEDWTTNTIDSTQVKGLSYAADCGGPFGWGGYVDGDNKYYYVTAIYKLGI
jgi:prepilin-type N-terminal cleavage/methylation domain-containing protein